MTSTQSLTFLVSNEFTEVELNRCMDGVIPRKSKSERKSREKGKNRARSERLRTNVLNKAFVSVFEAVPDYFRSYHMWKGKEGSVSKKYILQMATRYIEFLNDILCENGMTETQNNSSSLMNSDGMTGTQNNSSSLMNIEVNTEQFNEFDFIFA